jgi:hypothetical protein
MDFIKLIEPYNENGRTLEGQIKWLEKQGLSQGAIDYSVTNVYKRLESGEKFTDGKELDIELKRVATDYHTQEIGEQFKKRISDVEYNLDVEWNKLNKGKKIWQVITGKA